MNDIEQSPAYAALTYTARRVLPLIVAEIERNGNSATAIKSYDLMEALGVNSTANIAAAVRILKALGFISTTTGKRCISTYSLSDAWRKIGDAGEAKHLATVARETKKRQAGRLGARVTENRRRKPVEQAAEVEAEPEQRGPRPITLPVLAWPANPNAGV